MKFIRPTYSSIGLLSTQSDNAFLTVSIKDSLKRCKLGN